MGAERKELEALIESVADGNDVDWQQVEAAARDDGALRTIRDLRLVADIAALHRTHVDSDDAGSRPRLRGVAGGLDRWGHLVLIETIGEGAFGTVYRAHDSWLDRDVALKLLKPTIAGDVPTASLLREAQSLARVRHPNVVLVHGADVHGRQVGLWMELLEGQTLAQILWAQGPFGAAEAALIGQQVCRALGAVHAAGLVHRDVKATNVMREPGGRLVLMDFGAGHRIDPAGEPQSELVGTPLYLAPELLAGAVATPRSDIYSLGVLLYHLVTGKYPVSATSLDELRAAHAGHESQRLRDVRPDLPDAFVSVVDRALNPDAGGRFESAGEMRAALASAASSSPGPQTPVSGPWWRRYLLAAAAMLVLSLSAAMLASSVWRDRNTPPGPVAPPNRLAVLAIMPFQNASADPAEAYLASAVPMELAARLGHVGALRVVPWSFMKRFTDGGQYAPADVSARTGADALVEGTVQRLPGADGSPGAVLVHVQIFHAGTGRMLWTASLQRDLGDFFELQAEIAEEIAARLQIAPSARDHTLVSRTRQVPREAMEDYLRARQLLEVQMNVAGAEAGFRRAVERAPDFAEAHVGLAWCAALESAYMGAVPTDVALRRTLESSSRALEIDADMPEAWTARGFARFALEGNFALAEADLGRARQLGPASPAVLQTYSNYLTDRGRHAEAIQAALDAESRAPFSVTASRQVAWAYYIARQHDRAIQQARRTLEIEPGYPPARTVLGRALLFSGQHAAGVKELESVGPEYETMLAVGYAMAGRRDDATTLLNRITSPSAGRPAVAYDVAQIHAALGDHTRALEWLERAYTNKDASITMVAVDPMFDTLRGDPRFAAFLQKVSPAR